MIFNHTGRRRGGFFFLSSFATILVVFFFSICTPHFWWVFLQHQLFTPRQFDGPRSALAMLALGRLDGEPFHNHSWSKFNIPPMPASSSSFSSSSSTPSNSSSSSSPWNPSPPDRTSCFTSWNTSIFTLEQTQKLKCRLTVETYVNVNRSSKIWIEKLGSLDHWVTAGPTGLKFQNVPLTSSESFRRITLSHKSDLDKFLIGFVYALNWMKIRPNFKSLSFY